MIEYVVPGNMDDRVAARTARLLEAGGVAALPTDTSWNLVCSSRARDGVKRLRALSAERDERHFTLLCSDISQFGEWCSMDNTRFRLIKRLSPGPYVFILKTLAGTEKTLGLRRSEAGIRIPNHPVPLRIIASLGAPLYSITAKRSMTDISGRDAPHQGDGGLAPIPEEDLFEGGWELEGINGIGMILDDGGELNRMFSTILDLSGDAVHVLRQGAGPWPV
ncbi:MAG: L-threonylcarbamoyladenylate synthase [Treponema sp.]|jgi:tRNA threonylcarbamoyl adenosine modification protein (Sua5/YciO/YrdC/YwlC family)|nr:L-threonylcarbamoyladenylate synthase [Treponema sp.]